MKKIKTLLIVLIIILCVSITGLLVGTAKQKPFNFSFNFDWKNTFNFINSETETIQTETFKAEDVNALNISVTDLDLVFNKGITDEVLVTHINSSDASKLSITLDNATLTITQPSALNFWFFNWGHSSPRIEITLPEAVYESVTAHTVSGDIMIPSLNAKNIKLDSTSGDFNLSRGVFDTLQFDTTSGDISLTDIQGAVRGGTVSGDIDILNHTGSVHISTTSGDVDIHGVTLAENSEISTISGEVELQFTRSSPPIILDASSVSGDINNRFIPVNTETPLELRIRTTSGDIDIN